MRFSPNRLALMAAAALTFTTAAVAVAQDGPPPPGPPPMADDGPGGPGGLGGPGGPGGRHHFDPEAHAQHLRDVLQLRADQDGALKTYLAATGPKDRPGDDKGGPGQKPADGPPKRLTTPERLDRETQFLAHARARIDATRTFYAALSPSQQKAFDAIGPMAGGPGPMMHRAEFRHGKRGPGGPPPKGEAPDAKRKAS
jgi:hypothetical protein